MYNYFLVFIGGGLGSICRYGIAHFLQSQQYTFPFATFLANVISCVILGFFVGLSMKNGMSDIQKFMIMTGFCGGFSTFSTFTNETFQLFQTGELFYAITNIIVSLIVCLISIYIGIKLAG